MITTEDLLIDEFINDIELYLWEHSIETIKISEKFDRFNHSYLIQELHIEDCGDIICCSDRNNILSENIYVMMAFQKSCVKKIIKIILDKMSYYRIDFTDGQVLIEF